jgi:hypothetical protein
MAFARRGDFSTRRELDWIVMKALDKDQSLDILTDGTSFWVVDGSKFKVFKYSITGSSLGSWAIDPADTHPTGITINPSNVSDVWIVDSGSDKVYQ